MDLARAAQDKSVTLAELAADLDKLAHRARVDTVFTLDRAGQRALYEKAANEITLDDFVRPDVPALKQVIHHGKNTLPLPPSAKFFQKVFCRPADGTRCLFGFNEGPPRALIGPGYFVAVETQGNRTWEPRGAVVVDYFQVPHSKVVKGWPRVIPNEQGLQWFVFRHTRDFMRRVSEHVTIGAAFKGEKQLDHYFVLVRED